MAAPRLTSIASKGAPAPFSYGRVRRGSPQRTWAENDGAKPSTAFCLLSLPQIPGAPYLARFSRDVGYHGSRRSLPVKGKTRWCSAVVSQISRKTSEIWGTRDWVARTDSRPQDLWKGQETKKLWRGFAHLS